MDRIHDRANKMFCDLRKRKSKAGSRPILKETEKKENFNISDVTVNHCMYCEKVFINSNYLLKHIFRRHSENFIKLHRKCAQPNSSDSFDLNSLFVFLEKEFLELKSEISTVKEVMSCKDAENVGSKLSVESEKDTSRLVERVSSGCIENISNNLASNDVEILKEKVNNIEHNIQGLRDKFEELDSILRTEVMNKNDFHKQKISNEEKFLREQELRFGEIRQILLKELKSVLSKELHENNIECKSKISDLKHDILKLDHVIADIKKQVDSPDFLLAIEKRLEGQIVNFLGNSRSHSSKRSQSRSRNKLSVKKIQNSLEENNMPKNHNFDGQTISCPSLPMIQKEKFSLATSTPKPTINCPKFKTLPVIQEEKSCLSNSIPGAFNYIAFLVAEKLSYFSIAPDTSRITCTEFKEKMELINSEYEYHCKKYPKFSEIHSSLNAVANHRAFAELKNNKKSLRFSDPLILNKDISYSPETNSSHFLNKTIPPMLRDKNPQRSVPDYNKTSYSDTTKIEKRGIAVSKQTKLVSQDVRGSGDYYSNLPEGCDTSFKEINKFKKREDSMLSSPSQSPIDHCPVKEKYRKGTSIREYKTSSPVDHIPFAEELKSESTKEYMTSSPTDHGPIKEKRKQTFAKEFKTSSSFFTPHETEKVFNIISNGFGSLNTSVPSDQDIDENNLSDGGKTSYPVLAESKKFSPSLKSSGNYDNLENESCSELDECEDESSLKSLSSWDDDDSPFRKKGSLQ